MVTEVVHEAQEIGYASLEPEFSIILPVSNEIGILGEAVEKISSLLRNDCFELLIAEDNSTDGTDVLAATLVHRHNNVRHMHADSRSGRGEALNDAFRASRGRILMYMDVDLSTALGHIEDVLSKMKKYDIVVGSRLLKKSRVQRSSSRRFLSLVYNFFVRLFFRSKVHDHQCGFKAFRRDVALELIPQVKATHWFWDTELLIKAQRHNYKVYEVPVNWSESKRTTKVRFLRDSVKMALQIIGLWWDLNIRSVG